MQKIYEAFRAGDRESAKAHVAAEPTLAIFAAAIFGDAAEIETLLSGNRSLANAVSPDGWLPLHLAAHFGGFTTVIGVLALIWGGLELAGTILPFELPVFPILLVVLGLIVLFGNRRDDVMRSKEA